jgi:hypothetical protein
MSIFLGALLLGGVVVLIALPFFVKEQDSADPGVREALPAQKEEIYGALKDIELDYRMGKLSREDYEELNRAYRQKALRLLRVIDRQAPSSLDARIEEEVAAYRRGLADRARREEGSRDER